jgi:carbon storage regulator
MLVLSRKAGEVVRIGDEVVLTVLRLQGGRVQLGIAAPPGVRILRREVGELEMAAAEPGERPA